MSTTMWTSLKRPSLLVGGLAISLTLTGCGAFHQEDFPLDGPTLRATENPQSVTAQMFGHSWPLTADSGTVGCEINRAGDPILTFTDPDGIVYALNSVEGNSDNAAISQILDGSIGPIRTFAFTVCDVGKE